MNLIELALRLGGRKRLASEICVDRQTIYNWHRLGIPLKGALSVCAALDARAKELQDWSKRIRKAVTDARLKQEKRIDSF